MLKRKQIKHLNQKRNLRRNSFITESNCRAACKEWGIRDPLRSCCNKKLKFNISNFLSIWALQEKYHIFLFLLVKGFFLQDNEAAFLLTLHCFEIKLFVEKSVKYITKGFSSSNLGF